MIGFPIVAARPTGRHNVAHAPHAPAVAVANSLPQHTLARIHHSKSSVLESGPPRNARLAELGTRRFFLRADFFKRCVRDGGNAIMDIGNATIQMKTKRPPAWACNRAQLDCRAMIAPAALCMILFI
jgi:hypothetical protein